MAPIDPGAEEYIPPEAASTYTKLAAAYGEPYYRTVVERIAPDLRAAGRLLDAGTGPGIFPIVLAERTAERAIEIRIDAFDFTRRLVAYGRWKAEREGVDDRISFFTGDCNAVPAIDRSYDAITCLGVLHSLEEPLRALEEFYRVLEPGGTAWVFDPTIFDLPEEPDIELSPHERAVFDAYGVRSADDERPLSVDRAEELLDASPFESGTVTEGDPGDVRLRLDRRE